MVGSAFMHRWLQFVRAGVALGLVAGFLATPVGLAHPGAMQHDDAGARVFAAAPDAGGRHLTAAPDAESHGHCFTCHWFQSLRTAFAWAACVPIGDATSADLPRTLHASPAACATPHIASRAPPLS